MEVIKERKKKKKEQIISAKEQKNYYLCNKTTSIGVNRVVEFKCIFFVIYTTSSDYQEHFVDSSYQVSIPYFILKELTNLRGGNKLSDKKFSAIIRIYVKHQVFSFFPFFFHAKKL